MVFVYVSGDEKSLFSVGLTLSTPDNGLIYPREGHIIFKIKLIHVSYFF